MQQLSLSSFHQTKFLAPDVEWSKQGTALWSSTAPDMSPWGSAWKTDEMQETNVPSATIQPT